MPRTSIVLPVYNGARYLDVAIQSVLAQSYKEYELIIVDDGSTDETPSIVQKYAQQHNNIRYIRNKVNIKLPASLNVGFEAAKGEYFTWTSCDNIYYPQALQILVKALEEDDTVSLVYSNMDIIDDAGDIIDTCKAGLQENLIYYNVVGACFLYRRMIAEKVGGYNEAMFLCEDYEYWLRMGEITKFKKIDMSLYQYRRHDQSLSALHERKIIEKGIEIQKSFFDSYIKNRKGIARFYAHLRAREIYNPFRQFYLLIVLYYHPGVFIEEILGLLSRRLTNFKNNFR